MNSQLNLTARAMRAKDCTIRHKPVDYIPLEERRAIIEGLSVQLWRLASSLKLDLGRLPMILVREDGSFDAADVVENTARLHVGITSVYHHLGTSDIASSAFDEMIDVHTDPKHQPNFRAIVDGARHNDHNDIFGSD